MKYLLCAIKDRAIDAFQPPMSVRAAGEAIRAFQDAINDPQNRALHAHPEDYDLYTVGHFDDTTGLIQNLDQPQQIAIGKQLKIGG